MVFDTISGHNYRNTLIAKLLTGLVLGCLTLAIMLNPWVLTSGVVFDTRSIVLSLSALFFGLLPTVIATLMAFAYRLWVGGSGVYMGCSVIVTSALWGLLWKRMHNKKRNSYGIIELYFLGIVNHVSMLAMTILLPSSMRLEVLSTIAMPVLFIYPLATVLLGQILVRRALLNWQEHNLVESERQFRALYDEAPIPYQSLDEQGNIITVNQTWLQTLGYKKEEVIGKDFSEFLHPDNRKQYYHLFPQFIAAGHIEGAEHYLLKKDGSTILVSCNGIIITNEDGSFNKTQCILTDITEHRNQEAELRSIEWMLTKQHMETESSAPYGDLTELNTSRLILDSVGKDVLSDLVKDYLSLLDTSSTVTEKNGDFAIQILTSSWCQYLNSVSRELCKTEDNFQALHCGKWLCNEFCWKSVTQKAVKTGEVVDLKCHGGLNVYAVPIRTSTEVIGSINLSYGTPPSDDKSLKAISTKYGIELADLKQKAAQYQIRPAFIIEQAKRKLQTAARIIGEIVERRQAELIMADSEEKYRSLVNSSNSSIVMLNEDGVVHFANLVACKTVQLSEAEVIGKPMEDFFPPEFAKSQRELIHEVFQSGESQINEAHTVIFGKETWFNTSISPVFNAAGKPYLAIINATDITHIKEADLALRESQSMFKQFIDFIPGGVFISDKNSIALYVNKHILDVFGEEGGVGASPLDTFPPDIAEALIADDRLALQKGYRRTEEVVPHEDGTQHTYEATKFAIKRENADDLLGGIILDITDRKNAELAMFESQSRFEQFMNQIPGNAFIKDKNSCFQYVNKHMVQLFGADAWIGKSPFEIFQDHEAQGVVADDQLVLAKGTKQMVDAMQDPEGKIHYYETTKFTFQRPDSEILIGGLSLDITDKTLAEEEIRRYTRRLEILQEIDSIVLETLSFETVSHSVLENLQKLVPCSVIALNEIHGENNVVSAIYMDSERFSFIESDKLYPVNSEFAQELKDNKVIIIDDANEDDICDRMLIRSRLIKEGMHSLIYISLMVGEELLGFIAFVAEPAHFFSKINQEILIDIAQHLSMVLKQVRLTEAVKRHSADMETKVDERTEQLLLANKELESFSYTMAHDLRSPLRSIDGFCTILMEDYISKLDEEAIKLFNVIQQNTRKMDSLIKELLELTKLNPYNLKQKKVNMGKVVNNALERMFTPEVRAMFDIHITALPEVYADEILIHQVWKNLIDNAIKFSMPKQEKKLEIGSYQKDDDLVYYIKDGGVGFNMKYIDKIFIPFQRLHTEAEFEGNGIGLAIVHKIIQRHNGTIWAESAVGVGTTFFFSLPGIKPDSLS